MLNRIQAPQIKTIKHLHTGFPVSDSNVYRINSEEGVFKLEIVFPNGGYSGLDNKFAGIYAMDLLFCGTKTRTSKEIADSIDVLGAFIFKSCDYYTSSITVYGLMENTIEILNIVKENIENCVYPLDEVNIFKNKKNSELKININKTNYLANRQINHIIFGKEHPYSKHLTEDIINALENQNFIEFKNNHLKDPYFIFTGSQAYPIETRLKDMGYCIEPMKDIDALDVPPTSLKLETLITKLGSTQNALRMGKLLPSRKDPEFFKISLLNLILGGYFGSRLMKNIREEKGLTYGIHSSITPFKSYSVLKISSECNNKLTDQVKDEIFNEIKKLQSELIEDEELTTAKNYLLGAVSRNFDGAFNISERFKSFLEIDRDYDYYNKFFNAISNISKEELKECANNYLDINTLYYCVAGEM